MAPLPNPERLPMKTSHSVMWAYSRYVLALDHPRNMRDKIPHTNIPGPGRGPGGPEQLVPFIVEAPLNSVEVFEAIFRPSQPFKIHTARHIPRGRATTATTPKLLKRYQRLYEEFIRFQGRLTEEDREISFVCLPVEAIETLRKRVWGRFWPVMLHYISIPWGCRLDGQPSLEHPWALVLDDRPESIPGSIHTYETRVEDLLEELGIADCDFERNLLKPGTTPLPECAWDWIEGVPGKTAALPYYALDFTTKD